MATASAITAFVRRPRSDGDSRGLIIEQAPWPKGTGRVSPLQIILAADAQLFGLEPPEIECGVEGDGFTTAVYVYPYDPGLAYRCGVTHGSLAHPVRTTVTMRETVSFAMATEATLKYPLRELVSIDWLAEVWSAAGAVVANPALSVDGETVRSAAPIYGTAEVVYTTLRDSYGLQITARDDAVENVYQSVFWADWNGGVKLLVIEAPEGAEEDHEFQIECTGGSVLQIPPDDPDQPPAPSKDRTITLDYCEDFK